MTSHEFAILKDIIQAFGTPQNFCFDKMREYYREPQAASGRP